LIAVPVLLIGFGFLGFLLTESQNREADARLHLWLETAAGSKAKQLAEWRAEREGDGRLASATLGVMPQARSVFEGRGSPADRQSVQSALDVIRSTYSYTSITLFDDQGYLLLWSGLPAEDERRLPSLSKQGADPFYYSTSQPGEQHLSLTAKVESQSGKSLGTIALNMDPETHPFQDVQSWPGAEMSGEVGIWRKDPDAFVLISKRLHGGDPHRHNRIAANSAAYRAVAGGQRILQGADYVGVQTVGAVAQVADSPWYVVAKVDLAEVTGSQKIERNLLIALLLVSMALSGMVMMLVMTRRNARFYRDLYETEKERNLLRVDQARKDEEIRTLGARLLTSREEERKRLAGELHDGLNQEIAAVGIALDNCRRALPESAPERLLLQTILDNLRKITDSVRLLSHRLHPAVLSYLGLSQALSSLAIEFQQSSGIRIDYTGSESFGDLPPDLALALYRIAQESLQNILKHSQATRIEMNLTRQNNTVGIEIRDNGIGFSKDDGRKHGLGLVSMEERARSFGGTLEVESGKGTGTTVRAAFPTAPATPLQASA
jgi:signal transduction histidine kinase